MVAASAPPPHCAHMPKTFRAFLTSILLALTFAACTDSPPAWQLECEATPPGNERGNVCKAACGADHECPSSDTEGRDAAARGDALLVPNAIGLGVGAVGLGVGVTLLVLHAAGGEDAAAGLAPTRRSTSRSVLVRF